MGFVVRRGAVIARRIRHGRVHMGVFGPGKWAAWVHKGVGSEGNERCGSGWLCILLGGGQSSLLYRIHGNRCRLMPAACSTVTRRFANEPSVPGGIGTSARSKP